MSCKDNGFRILAIGAAIGLGFAPLAYCQKEETKARYEYRTACIKGLQDAGKEVGFWDCR